MKNKDYKEYNERILTGLGLNIQSEEEGMTVWYVSGGKTMSTFPNEKITMKDILNRYGAARYEEGTDTIKFELRLLLGFEK